MTDAQRRLRDLKDRQSRERGRMMELSRLDSLDDEQRAELDKIEAGTPDLERLLRAATLAVEEEDRAAKVEGAKDPGKATDPEEEERAALRGKVSVARYLSAALKGRMVDGAEAELCAAEGIETGQIPMTLWSYPVERRDEDRAITPAPGTPGVNLDTLRPAVFAPSIASKLMLDMPIVPSGTYATGTITTSATADAVAKSAAVPDTAAAFTVVTTTPHRVGAALDLTLEDIAAAGTESFEPVLRQHIALVLADEIDDQLVNGDGQNDDLTGFFQRLADPSGTPSAVATFDDFVGTFVDGIDGLWATMMSEVAIVAGVDTYRLSGKTFRDPSTGTAGGRGDTSFADYAKEHTAGWWTNSRMPATASNIQQAILCRKGRSMMPAPTRTAVCPVWFGSISIDDIYSGAKKGERSYTLSVLLGDVIIVQTAVYSQVQWQVSS